MMDLLEASAVSKRYGGIAALSRAEFHAAGGEVHALLGENGAGKSTFIQILAGAVQPDEGVINFNGAAFRATDPSAAQDAGISAVFQELSLIPDLTVEQNIWFRRERLSPLRTIRRRALRDRTEELFARYAFETLGNRRFEWKTNDRNEASKRAARRFGFTSEGIFRQHMIVKGESRDTAWFSMLDSEWPSRKAGFEAWLDPANFDATGQQKTRLEFS